MAAVDQPIVNKQILHRYILKIVKDDASPEMKDVAPQMDVIVSFYRGQVDPTYQLMLKEMIDGGLFDEFISATLQGLVHQGKSYEKRIGLDIFMITIRFLRETCNYALVFQEHEIKIILMDFKPWQLLLQ